MGIDFKRATIRIHRNTLNALEIPPYVQLMINPEKMIMCVVGVEKNNPSTHRVDLTQLEPNDQSFRLHSKPLTSQIHNLLDVDLNCSYRLLGKAVPNKKVALFSLKTMQKVEVGEIRNEE